MATVHFIQQGKGGVGKSMIASMLYQVFRLLEKEVVAFDTDPVNATLAGFKEFEVTRLDILKNGDIDPRQFDALIDAIMEQGAETHIIVDNGASSFLALNSYIKENNIIGILEESGHAVFFHSVITGGQAIGDTVLGLRSLALGFPATPIVVWLNPYFGEIVMDGKSFEEFKVYQEFSEQFHAIIAIPQGNKATIGKDLETLFAKRQSFETAINSGQSIVVRSRLQRYRNELVAGIEQAGIVG
ncbi:nucleotide-binding protein [Oleidesulfovibrio alaskensis]